MNETGHTRIWRQTVPRTSPVAAGMTRKSAAPAGAPQPPDLRPLTPAVLTTGEKYGYDAEHAGKVADLALRIFEQLPQVHGLGPEWAPLLQHAALLHDIGYFVHARRHHRHSQYLIRHDALLSDYPQPWREALGLVARNHRKRPRAAPHAWGAACTRAVLGLSAMLRIADGCDYGHDAAARLGAVRIRRGGLELSLSGVSVGGISRILRRKSRLFARTYALPITFTVEA